MDHPSEVTRVVCVSLSKVRGSVMAEMFRLRDATRARGRRACVNLALHHASGWFVLWYEGPSEGVDIALEDARQDVRHERLHVLHRSTGPASLSDELTLSSSQGPDSALDFARRVHDARVARDGAQAPQPAQLWQSLTAPCSLAAAGAQAPQRHVAVVASEYNDSIDVIRYLADQCASAVVYQRFAGGEARGADVGAAYVDIACGNGLTRFQALSRRALGQPMVRQSLAGLGHLVLLLGSRPEPVMGLSSSVAELLQSLPHRVEVRTVAHSAGMAATAAEVLGPAGGDVSEIVARPGTRFADTLMDLVRSAGGCGGKEAALQPG